MTDSERLLSFVAGQHRIEAAAGVDKGVTAAEAAEETGIWPDLAAAELKRLAEDKVLERRPGHPDRYGLLFQNNGGVKEKSPKGKKPQGQESESPEQPAFSRIIGADGSLRLQTGLAKAAAAYPPDGMHTLILGPSGVGKSLMAEEMWRFFCETRNPRPPALPFAVFNCAEYADNPQLLLAQIFGYVKGAFTGADSDHEGLVSQADGGVLFLDEIHRLPASGQEMFFTLLDKGIYRPLGGTATRHVRLMLIGATTESPDSFLLETFRRRIPVLLQLPSLEERPPKERLGIIICFLSEEARRIKLPIHVSAEAIRLLLHYKSVSNIGNLKNEIQICCAESYLHFQKGDKKDPFIEINVYSLSRKINLEAEGKSDIDSFLQSANLENGLVVTPEGGPAPVPGGDGFDIDFSYFVEERLRNYRNSLPGAPYEKSYAYEKIQDNLSVTISEIVRTVTNRLVEIAEHELGCHFERGIKYTLAVFLQQLLNIAKANRVISALSSVKASDDTADERAFFEVYRSIIEDPLSIRLTQGEINFISIILKQYRTRDTEDRVGLVLVALGASSASSIADFASQALMTNTIQAVNVPLDMTYNMLLTELCATVIRADRGCGVIVLADYSITKSLEKTLCDKTGVKCRVFPAISPMLAVEVYKNILTTKKIADEIYNDASDRYQREINHIINKNDEDDDVVMGFSMQDERNIIITYCITGLGSARLIRESLLQNPMISMTTDILTLGILDDISGAACRFGSRLKLIIGLINPHIEGVPFIPIENLPRGDMPKQVQYLLHGWNILDREGIPKLDEMSTEERLQLIRENIRYFAPSIVPSLVCDQADFITKLIAALYKMPLAPDVYVRIYIHTAAMLERITQPETIPPSDVVKDGIGKNKKFYAELRKIFRQFESKYNLTITDTEVYFYLIALPDPEGEKHSLEEVSL
jgi:transcriptional regulator with AAA-type ATPase domain/transcriptional regulatory protein LevR